jgi:serine/threonine protein kinase
VSEPGHLSHYRLVNRIDSPAGEAWAGVDTDDEREVALGILPREFCADSERLSRLREEARALASLDHPNIVPFVVEEFEGRHFYVHDLITGPTLSEQIPAGGLPRRRFFELALPLTDAIRAAHWLGITHRDLRAANVVVAADGSLRILGFGLADLRAAESRAAADPDVDTDDTPTLTMTHGSAPRTSVPYMSPEQVQGKAVDHRSDVFSLGSILYEMATGRPAFGGESPADVIVAVLRDNPPPVTRINRMLPESLERLLEQALAKDREARLESVQALHDELRRIRDETEPQLEG